MEGPGEVVGKAWHPLPEDNRYETQDTHRYSMKQKYNTYISISHHQYNIPDKTAAADIVTSYGSRHTCRQYLLLSMIGLHRNVLRTTRVDVTESLTFITFHSSQDIINLD